MYSPWLTRNLANVIFQKIPEIPEIFGLYKLFFACQSLNIADKSWEACYQLGKHDLFLDQRI